MRTSADLLDAVEGLADSPDLTPATVEAFTHVTLTAAASGNPYYEGFRGAAGAGPISAAELRVPGEGASGAAGPLLILTIAPGTTTTAAELTRRFGEAVGFRPPPPTAADSAAPTTFQFARGGSRISVALTSSSGDIRTISLERPRR